MPGLQGRRMKRRSHKNMDKVSDLSQLHVYVSFAILFTCFFCDMFISFPGQRKSRIVIKRIVKPKQTRTTEGQKAESPSKSPAGSEGQPSQVPSQVLPPAELMEVTSSPTLHSRSDTMSTIPESLSGVPTDIESDGVDQEYQHYTGGVSQFREYEEHNWQYWDWPPQDWRPSRYHDAYWNQSSAYYKYNDWKWSTDELHTPPPAQSVNTTTPEIVRSTSSDEVDRASQLLRASTGDLVATSKPAATGEPQVAQPAAEQKVSQPAAEQNGTTPPVPPKHASEATVTGPEQKDAVEGVAETVLALKKEEELTEKEKEEREKKRKAAHARYMRYYRNIRSSILIIMSCFLNFGSLHMFCKPDRSI